MPSVSVQPIYLPDVENNPQPSRYLDLIRTCQNAGRETWNIWYLFAFRPEMTQHLARFTQEVMREPSQIRFVTPSGPILTFASLCGRLFCEC